MEIGRGWETGMWRGGDREGMGDGDVRWGGVMGMGPGERWEGG